MSLATDAAGFATPPIAAAAKQNGAGNPLIVVEGVVKIYSTVAGDSVLALDNVDLTVRDGEFVCLVGPSGCGKTTLLRLLAGLDTADAGTSSLAGKTLNGPSPEVGVVFQQSNLLPWFTVLQNVMLPLRVGGSSRDAGKIAEIHKLLEIAGLKGFENKYPYELSGGMQQRAAIVRALARDPKLLLMDEPFGALDPLTRLNMQDLLVKLWKEVQATVFFITHSIEEAVFLGDRVYLMSNSPGTITEELKIEPANRPAHEMQRQPEFLEAVYYIRDKITKLESNP